MNQLTGVSYFTGYSAIVMTSRLRALGGRINNIRTSELPKEKARSEVVCNVRFLDGLVQTFKVNVSSSTMLFELMLLRNNFHLLFYKMRRKIHSRESLRFQVLYVEIRVGPHLAFQPLLGDVSCVILRCWLLQQCPRVLPEAELLLGCCCSLYVLLDPMSCCV